MVLEDLKEDGVSEGSVVYPAKFCQEIKRHEDRKRNTPTDFVTSGQNSDDGFNS